MLIQSYGHKMKKIITFETIRNFCYVNDTVCTKPIRGIVLNFFGLGGVSMFEEDTPEGKRFGEKGILYVTPYNNPWAWMNSQAVAYTDEIIDVLMARFGLSGDTPIVSSGGSMGGLSALVYTQKAKYTPILCVANCPVCDLPYHYTERPDLPRTLYSAFYHEEGTLENAMKTASPYHLAEKMPHISYVVFHCTEDQAVNKEKHSDRFVEKMIQTSHTVEYRSVDGRGHCDLTSEEWDCYYAKIEDAILKHKKG